MQKREEKQLHLWNCYFYLHIAELFYIIWISTMSDFNNDANIM